MNEHLVILGDKLIGKFNTLYEAEEFIENLNNNIDTIYITKIIKIGYRTKNLKFFIT